MIKDFESVKKQLAELSQVVNAFKSEAVQLRIVELIFGASDVQDDGYEEEPKKPPRRTSRKKQPRPKPVGPKVAQAASSATGKTSRVRTSGGPTDVLRSLTSGGYFQSPRPIGEIIDHCRVKLGRTFKPNELSPGLLKLVKEKLLDRDKDEESKQYKYRKAGHAT